MVKKFKNKCEHGVKYAYDEYANAWTTCKYCKPQPSPLEQKPTPSSTIQEIEKRVRQNLDHTCHTIGTVTGSGILGCSCGYEQKLKNILALFLKDRKRIYTMIEGLKTESYTDCTEYKTGSAKFHACRFYNEKLFEFNQKIDTLLESLSSQE